MLSKQTPHPPPIEPKDSIHESFMDGKEDLHSATSMETLNKGIPLSKDHHWESPSDGH